MTSLGAALIILATVSAIRVRTIRRNARVRLMATHRRRRNDLRIAASCEMKKKHT